jgi:hypothetical protein
MSNVVRMKMLSVNNWQIVSESRSGKDPCALALVQADHEFADVMARELAKFLGLTFARPLEVEGEF